jgi:hypothetical protein
MSLASTPPELAASQAQQWTALNRLMERELATIAEAFEQAGIQLAVLKGVLLTRRLHGGLEGRFSIDNDLMVRRADVESAARVLGALGYAPSDARRLTDDLSSTFQHPMRRNAAGAVLRAELHWHAFPPHLFHVPEQLLWSHMTATVVDGQSVCVFDRTMTLLHLASHYVQHRCSENKVLRDVGAAWQHWEAQIDRRELNELAARCGLDGALAYAIDAAHRAGLCAAPAPLQCRRARWLGRLMPAKTQDGEPGYTAMLGSLLLASPSKLPGALLYELFPPLPILARIYGAPASRFLYLRYPLRLLRPLAALLARRRYSSASSAQTTSL